MAGGNGTRPARDGGAKHVLAILGGGCLGWLLGAFLAGCAIAQWPVGDCMEGQFRGLAIVLLVGGPVGALAGGILAHRLARTDRQ